MQCIGCNASAFKQSLQGFASRGFLHTQVYVSVVQRSLQSYEIVFCCETMPEINAVLAEKSTTSSEKRDIRLHAYILSISKFTEIQDSWGNRDAEVADFTANHVLFLEDNKEYLLHLFSIAGVEFARS